MSPFSTFLSSFSIKKSQTNVTQNCDNKPQDIKVDIEEAKEQGEVMEKASSGGRPCSLPAGRWAGQPGREEEMFALSLEKSPISAPVRPTAAWPLLPGRHAATTNWAGTGRAVRARCGLNTPPRSAKPRSPPAAPGRHRFRSRGCELTRYFHAYACEDMMEYAVEVHQWKLSRQASYQSGDWRQVQTEVTPAMRCSLLAWLGDVTRTLDLSLESWCLAVNYTDRFLASQLLAPDCLQLVGLTALWVAAKQEELLGLPPTTDQLVALCAETYTNINFIHMELILLAKLQFRLSAPTAAFFLAHLVAVEEGEKHWQEDLARHMVELVLEDYRLARLPPCKIANAVYVAIKGCDENAAAILESNCPRCEPDTADMWSEELFQMLLQKVLQNLAS